MVSADTSVLIRYLTNDDVKKSERFKKYLSGDKKLLISDVVWAETYYTLVSLYKLNQGAVAEKLSVLLANSYVVSNRGIIGATLATLQLYKVSFVDAYIAVTALITTGGKVLSFDRDFDKIAGMKRVEP